MFIYILSRLSLPDQIISTKKNIHVFGNIGSQLRIIVKCLQSNRSSVQSLQSPHPTHHIFDFTTFPIDHPSDTHQQSQKKSTCSPIKPNPIQNAPCQCYQNAPSPSEATNIQTAQMKRFNKKDRKKRQNLTLSPHPAPPPNKRATTLPTPPPNFHAED